MPFRGHVVCARTGAKWPLLLTLPSPGAGRAAESCSPIRLTPLQCQDDDLGQSRESAEQFSPPPGGCVLRCTWLCPSSHVLPRQPVSSRTKVERDRHERAPGSCRPPKPYGCGTLSPHGLETGEPGPGPCPDGPCDRASCKPLEGHSANPEVRPCMPSETLSFLAEASLHSLNAQASPPLLESPSALTDALGN